MPGATTLFHLQSSEINIKTAAAVNKNCNERKNQMAGDKKPVKGIRANQLAAMLEGQKEMLVIDCRPNADYHILHVLNAVNICASKITPERELLTELLQPSPTMMTKDLEAKELVLYDQETKDAKCPPASDIITILLRKLEKQFNNIYFLKGGFLEFSSCFPSLCEGKSTNSLPSSFSQPCLSMCDMGPTQILPYFYLGSQNDVLNKELMTQNGITHILNVSSNCPKPTFIPDSHFLRIPVNDSYCESLLPWLNKSVEFIDTVRSMKSRVLVHCLAGISRSAAIAIAYVMRTMDFSLDDAYRFVKDRRPSISPNFNFLGQLVEYEKTILQIQASAHTAQSLLHPQNSPTQEEANQLDTCEDPDEDAAILAPHFPTLHIPAQRMDRLGKGKGFGNDAGSNPRDFGKVAPEMTAFQQGFSELRLSPEQISHTSGLKRSFSLDVKSVYSSAPHVGCYQAAQPAETGPVPKLLGFQSKLVTSTFNPFTLLFGNTRKGRGKDSNMPHGATQVSKAQQKCSCLENPSPVIGADQGPMRSPCVTRQKDSGQNDPTARVTLSLPVAKSSPLLDYSSCLITVHGKRTQLSLFEHPYSGPTDCKAITPDHITRNVGLYADNVVKS
ncbi:dual specificity protein phosphatase 8-like [Chiloscyllium plagiosum]|uniref:dual specificity protein phosphatase 8-like n=1 Tax=Chiloscyllium plagiosum TaxID=36176 RepID=UPI001CB82748|nr:dual specificity protein phosphatase 8-like [Chiloscyllium plagiosum]